MASTIKSNRVIILRHVIVGVLAIAFVYVGWQAHSAWESDMRLWKSFGTSAFFLLWVTVIIGPAARLWHPLKRVVIWRREFGIWFFLMVLAHGYLIWDGWAEWNVREFFGYEYVSELDMYLRFEPGFGLANLMGMTAAMFALILAATSFDRVVSFLGSSSWKWLHGFSYVIFYLAALHSMYFAFIHYTPAPHRILMGLPAMYSPNLLAYYYLVMIISVFLAQMAAFAKTVRRRRNRAVDVEPA